tara:strand:- start:1671 stop:1817 length:147 start_codon:yes stop_codon:yes gene_type:complete
MSNKKTKIWMSPKIKVLGEAVDLIKGFAEEDPKIAGGFDGDLANATDA